MKHNELQRIVTAELTKVGNGFNVVSSNRRGRPDIIGHIGMIFIAVEVKVGRDKASPQQKITIEYINSKGGIALVVHEDYLQDFIAYVHKIKRDIDQHKPCTYVGKPIPPNLLPPKLEAKQFLATEI